MTLPTMTISIDERRREEFPTLSSGIYLLAHSLGPIPRGAEESMRRYTDTWRAHTSADAWESEWWTLADEVGERVARLIGAASGSVIPTPNATLAMATVASCFDFHGVRNRVVTTALDFPSMGYLWRAQERLGAEILQVPSDDAIHVDAERIVRAIDERTALVAVSHTSYRSSHRIDPRAIVERARACGAKVCLDAYQSTGVVPLDTTGLGVDFVLGGSIKWLCGGPACGWLYVRPDLHDALEPGLTGWFAHDNPFEFSHEAVRYAEGIRRFANGTTSIPGLYSVLPGLAIIESVGVERIASESRERTQRMIDRAQAAGLTVNSPLAATRRGGTVMIGSDDPGRLAGDLRERNIFVDWRPGAGIRVSPHFYNTDDEIDEAMNSICTLAAASP